MIRKHDAQKWKKIYSAVERVDVLARAVGLCPSELLGAPRPSWPGAEAGGRPTRVQGIRGARRTPTVLDSLARASASAARSSAAEASAARRSRARAASPAAADSSDAATDESAEVAVDAPLRAEPAAEDRRLAGRPAASRAEPRPAAAAPAEAARASEEEAAAAASPMADRVAGWRAGRGRAGRSLRWTKQRQVHTGKSRQYPIAAQDACSELDISGKFSRELINIR